eukprot:403361634
MSREYIQMKSSFGSQEQNKNSGNIKKSLAEQNYFSQKSGNIINKKETQGHKKIPYQHQQQYQAMKEQRKNSQNYRQHSQSLSQARNLRLTPISLLSTPVLQALSPKQDKEKLLNMNQQYTRPSNISQNKHTYNAINQINNSRLMPNYQAVAELDLNHSQSQMKIDLNQDLNAVTTFDKTKNPFAVDNQDTSSNQNSYRNYDFNYFSQSPLTSNNNQQTFFADLIQKSPINNQDQSTLSDNNALYQSTTSVNLPQKRVVTQSFQENQNPIYAESGSQGNSPFSNIYYGGVNYGDDNHMSSVRFGQNINDRSQEGRVHHQNATINRQLSNLSFNGQTEQTSMNQREQNSARYYHQSQFNQNSSVSYESNSARSVSKQSQKRTSQNQSNPNKMGFIDKYMRNQLENRNTSQQRAYSRSPANYAKPNSSNTNKRNSSKSQPERKNSASAQVSNKFIEFKALNDHVNHNDQEAFRSPQISSRYPQKVQKQKQLINPTKKSSQNLASNYRSITQSNTFNNTINFKSDNQRQVNTKERVKQKYKGSSKSYLKQESKSFELICLATKDLRESDRISTRKNIKPYSIIKQPRLQQINFIGKSWIQ